MRKTLKYAALCEQRKVVQFKLVFFYISSQIAGLWADIEESQSIASEPFFRERAEVAIWRGRYAPLQHLSA